ncbi:MAG: ATP-binding protein [Thermodesulfobacteriota bacterium]
MLLETFRRYMVSLALVVFALAAAIAGRWVFAAAAGVLAAGSFLHSRWMVRTLALAEKHREEAQEQACRAQVFTSVDQLSAGIGHEINNPLGIIAQETQWLEHVLGTHDFEVLAATHDCRDSLKEIARQVDRCKEVVQKLLSLARQMEPVFQLVDVNDLVGEMAVLVDREASPRGVRVARSLEAGLPMVSTDPPLLRQVVLNLMVNAAQAIERDGLITVTTRTADAGLAEIVVHDTGCGIPQEDLPKIFTPFFSTKGEGKGSGLGLALCRGIIERLGGKISVTSEFGRCSTFTIQLPVRTVPNQER